MKNRIAIYFFAVLIIVSGCNDVIPDNRADLNFTGKGIAAIPDSVLKMTNLERLDLGPKGFMAYRKISAMPDSPNFISFIPEAFGNLQKLIFLDLSFNRISRLPGSFAKLRNLEQLDLSCNYNLNIAEEKQKLFGMSNLKYLGIIGTRFDSSDIADLRKNLGPAVKIVTSLDELNTR